LFVDRLAIVTPGSGTPAGAVQQVNDFWQSLGAKTVVMSAEIHDEMTAAVSHLPHLLASAIAASTAERYVKFSGTGWQDTTRIAAGDPELWRQILLSNSANVLQGMDRFLEKLADFRDALASKDAARLDQLLADAKQIRDSIGGN
jgi:prephenate dehydrogenase